MLHITFIYPFLVFKIILFCIKYVIYKNKTHEQCNEKFIFLTGLTKVTTKKSKILYKLLKFTSLIYCIFDTISPQTSLHIFLHKKGLVIFPIMLFFPTNPRSNGTFLLNIL